MYMFITTNEEKGEGGGGGEGGAKEDYLNIIAEE